MAGGKQTARQKMINLMYLVFIAMLALNMSKEVLSAFGYMNEEISSNTKATLSKNSQDYEFLATKASDQKEKYEKLNEEALRVKELSSSFYIYLDTLKARMYKTVEDSVDYESMDKTNFLEEYFFLGDGKTKEGKEFLKYINDYRDSVIAIIGNRDQSFIYRVKNRFNTEDVIDAETKNKKDWLDTRYKGFPLVASLTNITQFQGNIVNTESEILSILLGGQQAADSEINNSNYEGIVRLDKSAYFSGETVTGVVVLGRTDATLVPTKVTLNSKDITKDAENGHVNLKFSAGRVGLNPVAGEITYLKDGKPEVIPYNIKYEVIARPESPVVSADKMNVVYKGVDNPISISLPGVDGKKIFASAPGLKKINNNGQYVMNPIGKGGTTVKIKVTYPVGSKKETKSKEFRIKDIPAAMGSVRGQYGTVRMPKNAVARTPIAAGLPDFDFDLKLKVNSFKVKVPGQLAVEVRGTVFDAKAKRILERSKRGDIIYIYAIKASIVGNSTYELKKVLPVAIEINN